MKSAITQFREENGRMTLEAFGHLFGVNKSTVLRWEESGVPADRVIEIERVTGIPRDKLLPNLFEGFVPSSTEAAA